MKIKETEDSLKENIENLKTIVEQCLLFFKTNKNFAKEINEKYNVNEILISDIEKKAKDVLNTILKLKEVTGESFFTDIKKLLLNDYGVFLDLLKMLFYQIVFYTQKQNIFDFITYSDDPAFNFIGGNFLLLAVNHKNIKKTVNQFFFHDIKIKDELIIDEGTELWLVSDMEHKIFPSDFYKIREYAVMITEMVKSKLDSHSFILLQQQVSELVKNAVKHGNGNDNNKIIRVWYKFDRESYKIIIEDQGEGFENLEQWNEFNHKRNKAVINQDIDMLTELVSFRTEKSDEDDGGNALFAALEYWDSGLIYNKKRNKVLAMKYFFTGN